MKAACISYIAECYTGVLTREMEIAKSFLLRFLWNPHFSSHFVIYHIFTIFVFPSILRSRQHQSANYLNAKHSSVTSLKELHSMCLWLLYQVSDSWKCTTIASLEDETHLHISNVDKLCLFHSPDLYLRFLQHIKKPLVLFTVKNESGVLLSKTRLAFPRGFLFMGSLRNNPVKSLKIFSHLTWPASLSFSNYWATV